MQPILTLTITKIIVLAYQLKLHSQYPSNRSNFINFSKNFVDSTKFCRTNHITYLIKGNNTAAIELSNNSNNNNYDHISMINKYLIKKCQYDLNRLYKIKLKQLQQKPIELLSNNKKKLSCDAKAINILPTKQATSVGDRGGEGGGGG